MSQDVIAIPELNDQQVLSISKGEWPLPMPGNGICDRWRAAFVAVRLQDVIARLYFDTPYPKLSVEDRLKISQRVDAFMESVDRELNETNVEAVVR